MQIELARPEERATGTTSFLNRVLSRNVCIRRRNMLTTVQMCDHDGKIWKNYMVNICKQSKLLAVLIMGLAMRYLNKTARVGAPTIKRDT